MAKPKVVDRQDWVMNVLYNTKDTDRLYKKLDVNQIDYYDSMLKFPVTMVDASAGTGKAQPLTSKVLGENSWIKMGDIKTGDKIFGEDGHLHNVIGVFPQGEKDVYEVIFNDSTSVRCCKDHLWTYQTPYMRDKNKGFVTSSLEDIMKKPLYSKSGEYKRWNIYIPVTKPIEFKPQKVEINPYLLGVLLGDGCFGSNISVSLYEEDVKEKVEKILLQDGFTLTMPNINVEDYRIVDNNKPSVQYVKGEYINRLSCALNKYNLRQTHSYDKFVPNEYKFNSPEVRLNILQGLIDTDGEIYKESCVYSTASKQLADDVAFLVQSLGGTATLKTKKTKYTYNNEIRDGRLCYQIYIKMPKDIKVFTSEKHSKKYSVGQIEARRTIREIKYIGKEQCQCIMTDNPSHLYITDNFIVTHNTTIAVMAGLNLLRAGKVSRIVYIRFPDKRYAKLGFLQGDKSQKEEILMSPFYDAAMECGLQPEAVTILAMKGLIELTTDICMRGRNLEGSFIILDEAQNGEIDDIRLIATRIHDNSKFVMIGHSGQVDNSVKHYGEQKFIPFEVYQLHMIKKSFCKICQLPKNYRGEISKWADKIDETLSDYC